MNTSRSAARRQRGFTLLELLVAAAVFLIIAGATLGLLGMAQQRYQADSRILASFQEARLGIDQIVRDVSDAGYPPKNHFSVLPAANLYAATPFAWSSGYPATPCLIGATCTTPADFDLIVETDIDPPSNNGVEWVRYQLPAGTTTLLRGVASKAARRSGRRSAAFGNAAVRRQRDEQCSRRANRNHPGRLSHNVSRRKSGAAVYLHL